MNIKKIIYIMAAFFLIKYSANAEVISIVTLEWPPFANSKKANGGTLTSKVVEAFKSEGIEVKVTYMPWARALKATNNGEFSAIFPAYYSKEREELNYISTPIDSVKVGFIKLKNTEIIYEFNKDDLNKTYDIFKKNNYTIGVIKSYVNETIFDQRNDLNKKTLGTDEQAVTALIEKKIDMYFGDNVFCKEYISKRTPKLIDEFEFIEPAVVNNNLYLLFPKSQIKSEILKEKFNSGFLKLNKENKL